MKDVIRWSRLVVFLAIVMAGRADAQDPLTISYRVDPPSPATLGQRVRMAQTIPAAPFGATNHYGFVVESTTSGSHPPIDAQIFIGDAGDTSPSFTWNPSHIGTFRILMTATTTRNTDRKVLRAGRTSLEYKVVPAAQAAVETIRVGTQIDYPQAPNRPWTGQPILIGAFIPAAPAGATNKYSFVVESNSGGAAIDAKRFVGDPGDTSPTFSWTPSHAGIFRIMVIGQTVRASDGTLLKAGRTSVDNFAVHPKVDLTVVPEAAVASGGQVQVTAGVTGPMPDSTLQYQFTMDRTAPTAMSNYRIRSLALGGGATWDVPPPTDPGTYTFKVIVIDSKGSTIFRTEQMRTGFVVR